MLSAGLIRSRPHHADRLSMRVYSVTARCRRVVVRLAMVRGDSVIFFNNPVMRLYSTNATKTKKPGPNIFDDSVTRLSRGDPLGFPPHPRGWLSIVVHLLRLHHVFQMGKENTSSTGTCQYKKVANCYNEENFAPPLLAMAAATSVFPDRPPSPQKSMIRPLFPQRCTPCEYGHLRLKTLQMPPNAFCREKSAS